MHPAFAIAAPVVSAAAPAVIAIAIIITATPDDRRSWERYQWTSYH